MNRKLIAALFLSLSSLAFFGCNGDDGTQTTSFNEVTSDPDSLLPTGLWGSKPTVAPFQVNSSQWGGLPIVENNAEKQYVIVKKRFPGTGTVQYVRIDWLVNEAQKSELFFCESAPKPLKKVLTAEGPSRVDISTGGCYSVAKPWSTAKRVMGLYGPWASKGSNGEIDTPLVITEKALGEYTVSKFTNPDESKEKGLGVAYLQKGSAGSEQYARFVWYAKEGSHSSIKGCFTAEDSDPTEWDKTLPAKTNNGCKGGDWTTYEYVNGLAFNGVNLADWKEGTQSVKLANNKFLGDDIVYAWNGSVAPKDLFTQWEGVSSDLLDASYLILEKKKDPSNANSESEYSYVIYRRDNWRTAHYCVVNEKQKSISEARRADLSKVTYDYTSGCKGDKWKTLEIPFDVKYMDGTEEKEKSLVGLWHNYIDDFNYEINTKWLQGNEIIAFFPAENASKISWIITRDGDIVTQTGINLTKGSSGFKVNYSCTNSKDLSSFTNPNEFNIEIAPLAQPDTSCTTIPTSELAFEAWPFSGYYKNSSGSTAYQVSSQELVTNPYTATEVKEGIFKDVIINGDDPQYVKRVVLERSYTKPTPAKYRQVVFYAPKDKNDTMYMCEVTPATTDAKAAETPILAANSKDLTKGCGSKPWTNLISEPELINGSWKRITGQSSGSSNSKITANQWEDNTEDYSTWKLIVGSGESSSVKYRILENPYTGVFVIRVITTPKESADKTKNYFYTCDVETVYLSAHHKFSIPTTLPTLALLTDENQAGTVCDATSQAKWVKYEQKK